MTDEQLANLVVFLREHDALCLINLEDTPGEAQILCSLGLFQAQPSENRQMGSKGEV